jgi:hypothetical protein
LNVTQALADIEKLVAEVAKKAVSSDTTLEQKMDALKLLQPYYAVLKKAKGKPDDDPSQDGPSMGDMRNNLRVVEQEPDDGSGIEASSRRAGNGT